MGQRTQHDQSKLDQLRASIARIERSHAAAVPDAVPFGVPEIDAALPQGGLLPGALHEVTGDGADVGHGVAAALFAAGVLARHRGTVLWVLERGDVFAPGLAGAGLHPDRVVYAEAGRSVLLVMEEGLRHRGLAGVVGEVSGRMPLTASRRLQLAAEGSGVMALALRRDMKGVDQAEPSAACTRWRIAALPAGPAVPHAPDVPGLARGRWRLELVRCRGGRTGSWVVEACDAQGGLGLVSALAHGPVAAPRSRVA